MMAMSMIHAQDARPSRELGALQEYVATLKAELERFANTTAYDVADATRRRNLAMKLLDDVRQLNARAPKRWWQRLFAIRRGAA
jgi:hypothetical protein